MSIKINIKTKVKSSPLISPRFSGKVKWFNPKIGYGFIIMTTGEEVFVHYNQIMMNGYRKLKTGQNVSFRLQPYDTYQQATEVIIYDSKRQ
jgi:CspA family cold shock protein